MIREKYKITDIRELQDLARSISKILVKGDVVALIGEIGSGKTTFSKRLINELTSIQVNEISSPTFNLYSIYNKNGVQVNHYDFYRVEDSEDLSEIDLAESYESGITIKQNVKLIEAERTISSIGRDAAPASEPTVSKLDKFLKVDD